MASRRRVLRGAVTAHAGLPMNGPGLCAELERVCPNASRGSGPKQQRPSHCWIDRVAAHGLDHRRPQLRCALIRWWGKSQLRKSKQADPTVLLHRRRSCRTASPYFGPAYSSIPRNAFAIRSTGYRARATPWCQAAPVKTLRNREPLAGPPEARFSTSGDLFTSSESQRRSKRGLASPRFSPRRVARLPRRQSLWGRMD